MFLYKASIRLLHWILNTLLKIRAPSVKLHFPVKWPNRYHYKNNQKNFIVSLKVMHAQIVSFECQ